MSTQAFDLDKVLLDLSGKGTQPSWTIRNAVEGVQIFGGIGSGKTSGSGRMLSLKYLANGFGGLVLTAKHDEKQLWEEYCRLTNRTQDLIIVEPGGNYHFNFLEYESISADSRKSLTLNIVQVLKTVIRANQEKSSGKSDDRFWETALDILIANTIDLCLLAYDKVTVKMLYDIAQSAPRKTGRPSPNKDSSREEETERPDNPFDKAFAIAMNRIKNQVNGWRSTLTKDELDNIKDNYDFTRLAANALPDVRTMNFVNDFFTDSFKNMADKTRSIIDFSLIGFLYNLLREPTYSLFCRNPSNFGPEDCLKGKIVLINLPVKDYFKMGQDCQIMFKYIWQRAMERRRVQENDRPVFLWADEAQHFLHEHDADYQATARSSRIATVYISQNLPNYYANMGGDRATYKVQSFLGTLGTKIFHANADIETNTYASDLIGQGYTEDTSSSVTMAGEFSSSTSKSYILETVVRPEEIVSLKTGGPLNNFMVDGYMHLQGNLLGDQFNYRKMRFNQKFVP